MSEDAVTINIDAGGTFTDGFFTRGESTVSAKVPTTEHDLTVCFMECIERGAGALSTDAGDLLGAADVVRFSTTAGTNAVLEKTGPRLGVLVTTGHEQDRYADEDQETVVGRFVEDDLIAGVEERVEPDGTITEEPTAAQVGQAVKRLQEAGARLVAVALENAYANDANERRVKRLIEEEYPSHYLGAVPSLASFEVTARPDDYRRLNTVVVNAYIHRPMKTTLYKAEDELRTLGYARPLFIGHSSGGAAGVAKTVALDTYNSGPAAGILGVRALADLYGIDAIGADMGGTSLDLGAVTDGAFAVELSPEIDGLATHIPAIDVRTAGAGGGSIASVEDGTVRVGPESAGANPGPACFGRGGQRATVTDADVVLGRVNPAFFLGGRFDLSTERARAVLEEDVGDPLGISPEAAAQRVVDTLEANIREAVERLEAETSTLIAYGGAGPTHAGGTLESAGIERVVVTPHSSVFSAFGESMMRIHHTYSRPLPPGREAAAVVEEMEAEARRDMEAEGFAPEDIGFDLDAIRYDPERGTEALVDVKQDGSAGEGLATLRLHAVGDAPTSSFAPAEVGAADPSAAREGERELHWPGGPRSTPIYRFGRLRPGNVVEGPAIVEAADTTVTVPAEALLRVNAYGHGVIGRSEAAVTVLSA